ncbi:MAG: 3-ketoacyl-ACP reductase [Candidatus Hatepunaea meridiana]|nr:3-ketoacyl-ACP reductase [Candidatus Hatepunaea meridiana]
MNTTPVAIVTGANRGIGCSIALALSAEGYNIIAIDLSFETTGAQDIDLKSLIEDSGVRFLPLQADISDIQNHQRLISEIIEEFGRIDVLVNNAGVAPLKRLDILETTTESFDQVLGVNLCGTFFLTQAVAKTMLKNIGKLPDYRPKIIFITSISAEVSSLNRAEYCISKAGLSMAAKVFADRLADSGINVYEIRPGIIQTDMTSPVKDKYDKLIAEGLIPQNRWGLPEDVAKVVVALAKGYFDYSTGMIFDVSGGMNIQRL